jgi:hypothetical protein
MARKEQFGTDKDVEGQTLETDVTAHEYSDGSVLDAQSKHAAEQERLGQEARRDVNWKRWGPYLAERQWGTVREDYSPDGSAWDYFPHDHARSRAYRWGEDGLLGLTDRECRLCFALALWNEQDPILKERLFGLTNSEGNHGEDVKECYFYLDSTPTHSYFKSLYKYPQTAFPYLDLVRQNQQRGLPEPEYELSDTAAFAQNRYFDVSVEYAKASPDDILISIRAANRGPESAPLHLLPTLWFRNTWSWGCAHEGCWVKPRLSLYEDGTLRAVHASLEPFRLFVEIPPHDSDATPKRNTVDWLFTENETNNERLFNAAHPTPYVKDAFHRYVVKGELGAINPQLRGTKAAAHFRFDVPPGQEVCLRLRLVAEAEMPIESTHQERARQFAQHVPHADTTTAFKNFEDIFAQRRAEADAFYTSKLPQELGREERRVARQAFAGLLHSKQFYHYVVRDWLEGDPNMPPPPDERLTGRNREWPHLFNRDVISMPDKWEYPWYAAWDLAFHAVCFALVDPNFAKEQLVLFLREWYMHPNGQIPAYEFALGDVNPPVHAWAAWRVYKMTGSPGQRDRLFLERVFQKLLLNFTWWVNRKDAAGKNIFAGGFLGMDNVGVFDRSQQLPNGAQLEQADGTAWMAFYCVTLLSMALELACEDEVYQDIASKFFEHFVSIVDAMNSFGGSGLWNEEDGFYYDSLRYQDGEVPIRLRSAVGIVPLFAAEILDCQKIAALPGFSKRMNWFLENRKDLSRHITTTGSSKERDQDDDSKQVQGESTLPQSLQGQLLLAIPSRERLVQALRYILDENEFLSPFGVRSLSRIYGEQPYVFNIDGTALEVRYVPGESDSGLFGGNSNWRGPIWIPINYLLVEALERYGHFYGDSLQVECPTGSGNLMNLTQVARDLEQRLCRIFLPDDNNDHPWSGSDQRFSNDPHWRDLTLFHEYFDGDSGAGLGASHQTGWTALVASLLMDTQRNSRPTT